MKSNFVFSLKWVLMLNLIFSMNFSRILKHKNLSKRFSDPDFSEYFNDGQIKKDLQKEIPTAPVKQDLQVKIQKHHQRYFRARARDLRQIKKKRKQNGRDARLSEGFTLQFRNSKNGETNKIRSNRVQLNGKGTSAKLRLLNREKGLVKMVINIRKQIKKKHVRITNVLVGSKMKTLENGKKLFNKVNRYLNSSKLSRQMKRLNTNIHREKRRIKKHDRKLKKKEAREKKKQANRRKLGLSAPSSSSSSAGGSSASGSSAGGAAGGDNLMKFNFLPGFAGMPFPPFMMNGPHFHPPLNVTVNSLPNPNPRAELDPKEIEEENVKTQLKALHPIDDKLNHVMREIDSISKESEVNLEDKYQRVLQLNN